MVLRKRPSDCSICGRICDVTLVEDCIWVCPYCHNFRQDLIRDKNEKEKIKGSEDIRFWTKE